MNVGLIFAGGTGTRYSSRGTPKQFLELQGKAVIVHATEYFESHPEIDAVCVVCKKEWISHFEKLKNRYSLNKVSIIAEGGETGQESIYKGLCAIHDHYKEAKDIIVLIHDGVRPLISLDLISENIKTVKQFGNAVTVSKTIDPVVRIANDKHIVEFAERSTCYHTKAPQCFYLSEILALQEQAIADGLAIVDSAALMLHYVKKLYPVKCSNENIKITTPVDYYLFKAIYEARESSQVFGI